VDIYANLKHCARKKHLRVVEHLCLEIPQKKQRRQQFFVSGNKKLPNNDKHLNHIAENILF